MEESKHVATHPRLGRGSSLRSADYQKRAGQKRLSELEVLKRKTIREMYPLLTSLVPLRRVPGTDKGAKKKNKESDRQAEFLRLMLAGKLSSLHSRAFQLGLHSSDPRLTLTSDDLMWLNKMFREEEGYFNKFFSQIRKGTLSAKQVDHRLHMYMNSSNATFESGKVVGASPTNLIYWIMDPIKDHCPVCVFLQNNSPYTAENLPTVPRSDACFGYSNCGCHLSFVRAEPDVMRTVKRKSKNKQQLMALINTMRKRNA